MARSRLNSTIDPIEESHDVNLSTVGIALAESSVAVRTSLLAVVNSSSVQDSFDR